MGNTEKVAITVAVIGLTGTLGAALISSGAFRQKPDKPAEVAQPEPEADAPANSVAGAEDRTRFAPHAPEIEVNARTQLWGEQTKLVSLAPGEQAELNGLELYSQATTRPASSCAGPGYVIYTWQVRHPYPEGGDMEIRWILPRSGGGNTERLALGAMGQVTMGTCAEHLIINRGLEPMKVELRYASAVDEEAAANPAADGVAGQ